MPKNKPTPPPTHKLTSLGINECSLVPEGDNPGAHITLIKLRGDAPPSSPGWATVLGWIAKGVVEGNGEEVRKDWQPQTTAQILATQQFDENMWAARCAFSSSVSQIMCLSDPDQIGPLMSKTVDEFTSIARDLVTALEGQDVDTAKALDELVKRLDAAKAATTPDQRLAFAKACADLEGFEPKPKEKSMPATAPKTKSLDEIIAALPEGEREAAKAAIDAQVKAATDKAAADSDAKAKAAADKAAAEAKAAADTNKSAEQREIEKRLDEANKAATEAKAEVEKLRAEKQFAGYVETAKALNVGDVDDVAKSLRDAYAVSDEAGQRLEKTMRAQAARVAKADEILTQSRGSAGSAPAADSVAGKIEARAKEIQKAESITFEKAYTKALLEDRAAYREMDKATPHYAS